MSSGADRPFAPKNTRQVPRFAGVPTFLRLPEHDDPVDVDVMICGAPFDGGTTYRPGARFGPRAVRAASALTRGYQDKAELDTFATLRAADGGDVACVPMDVQRSLEAIEARARSIAAGGAVPLFVGGDHTVSLAPLRALVAVHGPLGLVHFDAHSDTYGPAWGIDLHHGTVFRKAAEEGLLRPSDVLQIGLRGPYTSHQDLDFARAAGFQLFDMDAIVDDFKGLCTRLSQLRGRGHYYVSFDMDALDPAFAPGTGTPVPGGLSSYQALRLLRSLSGVAIVGGDVVEISPDHDPSGNTSLLAATVLAEQVALVAQRGVGT